MALYFDREVEHAPGLSVADVSYTDLQWHPQQSILAVASKDEQKDADGTVRFYSDEVLLCSPVPAHRGTWLMHRMCALQGSLVGDAVLQRSVTVECLAWHPTLRVLAAGWRSGEIALYDDHTRSYSEQSSAHRAPVTCLLWSNSGRRMISCDKARMTCCDHCCTCVCI